MPWVDRFVCGIHPWTEDGTCIPMFNGAASACLLHGDHMADSPLPHLAAGLQRLRLVQHRNIPASLRVLHVVILVARKTYRIFASWKTAWKRLPPTIGIVSIGFQWAVICQEVSHYTVGPALRGPVKHMGLCREEHFTAQRHRHACYLLSKGIRQHIRNEYLPPPRKKGSCPEEAASSSIHLLMINVDLTSIRNTDPLVPHLYMADILTFRPITNFCPRHGHPIRSKIHHVAAIIG